MIQSTIHARTVLDDGPFGIVGEDTPAGELSPEREQAVLDALRDTPPGQWAQAQHTAVRKALLEHLAQLGDGLLRVTDFQPAPLAAVADRHPLPDGHPRFRRREHEAYQALAAELLED